MEERARIARELHDVIAHSVSVIGLQAGAPQRMLDRDPERAREPLQSIQDGAREAVFELRRLLGILRDGDEPEALAPQPRLAELGGCSSTSRATGSPSQLEIDGVCAGPVAGRRALRLPDRAGGADERAEARARVGGP